MVSSKAIQSVVALLFGVLSLSGANVAAWSTCIASWDALQLAVWFAADEGALSSTIFQICPYTVLNASSGSITIDREDFIAIQCGFEGNALHECIIEGGSRHFNIVGRGVVLRGITFRNAQAGSIHVKTNTLGPAQPPDTVLEQCIFEENDSSGNTALGAAVTVHPGGAVRFEDCMFRDNVSFEGAVDVDGGDAVFDRCVFEDNMATGESNGLGGAAVYVYGEDAKVVVRNSCFLGNQGRAVVFLRSNGPTIEGNDNNYGENNTSTCPGVFHDSNGNCQAFEADACGLTMPSQTPSFVPSFSPTDRPTESSAPTIAPTSSPTMEPSFSPSDIPSTAPSIKPSLRPSDNPSVNPSMSPSANPSLVPSSMPSAGPSLFPSSMPSANPSLHPSVDPKRFPSEEPSIMTSMSPSSKPSAIVQIISFAEPTFRGKKTSATNMEASIPDFISSDFHNITSGGALTSQAKGVVYSLVPVVLALLVF